MGAHIGVSSFLLQLSQKLIEDEESSLPVIPRDECCLVVVGRGTTDPDTNSDVFKLTRMLWEGMGFGFATVAFSGTAKPSVPDGLELVEKLGFRRCYVVPFFFFTGILLQRIYSQVETINSCSKTDFVNTKAFGTDELILKAFDERLNEAIEGKGNMNCQLCKYRKQIIGFESEIGKDQIGHHLNVKGVLFEEDEKVNKKEGVGRGIRKILGI